MALTQTIIDRAKRPAKEYRLSDAVVPNLSLRVRPSGSKIFYLRFKTIDGKRKDVRIGDATEISLKEARELAITQHSVKTDQEDGVDLTFAEVISMYKRSPKFRDYSEKTQTWHQSIYNNHLLPKFGKRGIRTIRRGEWVAFLEGLITEKGGGTTARSAKNVAQAVYTWAEQREYVDYNILRGVKHVAKLGVKKRVLSREELKALWQIMLTSKHSLKISACTRIIMLTGQRVGETSGMLVGEVDLDKGIWTIPESKTKNGRRHIVPLSDQATSILRQVIGTRRSGRVFDVHEKSVSNILARYEKDERFAGRFTAHDLRRTLVTEMSRLGADEDMLRRVVNHAQSEGAMKHYNHYDYLDEKRALLQQWSDYLMGL